MVEDAEFNKAGKAQNVLFLKADSKQFPTRTQFAGTVSLSPYIYIIIYGNYIYTYELIIVLLLLHPF